jgi:4-amino-4-deoxy-L-arabinose transferase-like glycosyltransferase
MLGTNLLFQPVALDQLTTMVVLWLALRLALGRGSWLFLGVAAGIGLETKYTLAVVLVLLVAGFAVWRRDVLRLFGLALAVVVAAALLAPNLVWEAQHGWVSVHWFLNPPSSATDESRPQYVANVLLLTHIVAVPVAAAGTLVLLRERALRPLGATVVGTVVAYFLLGGKSYYALPVVLFALAVGGSSIRSVGDATAAATSGRGLRSRARSDPPDRSAGLAPAHGRPAGRDRGTIRLPGRGGLAREAPT